MTAVALAAMTAFAANTAVAPPASAWERLGCHRGTDMKPSTSNLDVYVEFQAGGHTDPNYYPTVAIDAANAWYAAVHNVILWKTPDGRSQIVTRAANFGAVKWAGMTSAGPNPDLWYSNCTGTGIMGDNTWIQANNYWTNGYSDNQNRALFVHEFGHAMGLAHPRANDNCNAIMAEHVMALFATCNSYAPRWDDVRGIQAIYPGRA